MGARHPVRIFPGESRPLRIRLGGAKDPGRRAGAGPTCGAISTRAGRDSFSPFIDMLCICVLSTA